MAATSGDKEGVEILQQVFGPSVFLNHPGPVSPANATLNRILIEIPEDFVYIRAQVENVQRVRGRRQKFNSLPCLTEIKIYRADLHILRPLVSRCCLQMAKQAVQFQDGITKWFAMI